MRSSTLSIKTHTHIHTPLLPLFGLDLDMQSNPVFAQRLSDFFPGVLNHLVNHAAVGAHHDLVLAVAFDIHGLIDPESAVRQLLPARILLAQHVGQVLMQSLEEFDSDQLFHFLQVRHVGLLLCWVYPRAGLARLKQLLLERHAEVSYVGPAYKLPFDIHTLTGAMPWPVRADRYRTPVTQPHASR